jgi:hypothetical protein
MRFPKFEMFTQVSLPAASHLNGRGHQTFLVAAPIKTRNAASLCANAHDTR